MLTRNSDVATRITRILFAILLSISILIISGIGLNVAGKQLASSAITDIQSSTPETTCPACRPICSDEEIPTFEVWYRTPDTAPPGTDIPLEVQVYAMGEQHDLETLTVTLPAGLEVNARTLPSWLDKSDRSVIWSAGAIEPDDQAGMWFTAELADSAAFGETLTLTITLNLDGEQCAVPARPLQINFPRRRLALPIVSDNDSFAVVQNLEKSAARALLFAWDADAAAPSRLLTIGEIGLGKAWSLSGLQADAGILYAVDADKINEAYQAAQDALGDVTAWQAWESRWQAGEFGWGSSLSALVTFEGTDMAAYTALDASLASSGGLFTCILPLIDLVASPRVTVAVQNIGQETTTGTWHAWPMTDTMSSISGTFTLPPGAATHIALGAYVADDFQGAVHVNADGPLAVVAMSQAPNTQSVYTAHPVGEPMAPDGTLRGLLEQSDWETELWIHNSSSSQTARATAVFQDLGGQAVYTATKVIPARGTWRLDVSSLPLPSTWTGWVRITGSPNLRATTRLINSETSQQADVETFIWPPPGLQAASSTWSFPFIADEGSLFVTNPGQSNPITFIPAFFDQTRLLDFFCESLGGGQGLFLPSFPFPAGFRGSMLIQNRASLSADQRLSPLSVYLGPNGLGYSPAGLPHQPQLTVQGKEIKCGLAGLMASQWGIPRGETRSFDLRLEDVGEVTSIDLGATFNPAILAVDDADPEMPGTQIQPGPAIDDTWVITHNIVAAGQITYTLGPSGSGTALPDAGSIAVIPFTGQQLGETAVTVTIRSITSMGASLFSTQPLTVTQQIRVVAPTPMPTTTPTATVTATPMKTATPAATEAATPANVVYQPLISKNWEGQPIPVGTAEPHTATPTVSPTSTQTQPPLSRGRRRWLHRLHLH